MKRIFHITESDSWENAKASGHYAAPSLKTQGFIHCSAEHQIVPVANFNFAGHSGLVLLEIFVDRIEPQVRNENLEGGEQHFPHIYGSLNTDAVERVVPFRPNPSGRFSFPKELFGKVELVRPNVEFKESYLDALREFQKEGLPWMVDLNLEDIRKGFEDFIESELKKKTTWTKDTPVDETELWGIRDGIFVGRISIRHKLNEDLKVLGGHIGYDTRPSCRGVGVASTMLKQALPFAKELGLMEVLLTCNETNLHSIRVIERNGGRLRETKPQFEGGPLKRHYTIDLFHEVK